MAIMLQNIECEKSGSYKKLYMNRIFMLFYAVNQNFARLNKYYLHR